MTSPTCSNACPPSVSTPAGSTASSADSRRRALADFQRNVSLPVDGILGASTLRELKRVMPRHAEPELVSSVRDRERLRQAPRTLLGRRLAIGEEGGLDVLVTAVRRHLAATGAEVVPLLHPDGSLQAAAANAAGSRPTSASASTPTGPAARPPTTAGYSYESAGGRRLAELLQSLAAAALRIPADGVRGMSLPVLRETRMPAVICELGPPAVVVARAGALARRHRRGPHRLGRHPGRLTSAGRPQERGSPVAGRRVRGLVRSTVHSLMHRLWITLHVDRPLDYHSTW